MTIHVIGAGVAGLAAAVRLLKSGQKVTLWEAGGQAGGRCRSYPDPRLGRDIDNGTHLVLSGNRAVMRYLDDIGAADRLIGPKQAAFPFVDLRSDERWTLSVNNGRLPWWPLVKSRRVSASRAWDYVDALRVLRASSSAVLGDCVSTRRPLYRRFWEPLSLAVLNSTADQASAALLSAVLKQSFGRGGDACRPLLAETSLDATFVSPALDSIARLGGRVHFGRRCRALAFSSKRVRGLEFAGETLSLADDDALILAVPPRQAVSLMPGLTAPDAHNAIINAHFVLPRPGKRWDLVGLIGGLAQWVVVRGDLASVTVSAAPESLLECPAADLATRLWEDVKAALELAEAPLGPYRVVKERRATIAQSPAQNALRPGVKTRLDNLFLAGDWINTGLPCTLESAVTSAHGAAHAADSLFRRAED